MTISLITAPPGGGKSYYSIRRVADALMEGRPVAGNVALEPGWERTIARRNWVFWLRPFKRRRFLREAAHRYHFSEDLDELFRLRLAGKGEGRGVMVLDEAHNWMNARSWSAEDRKAIVKFFSQHRKLGWDVDLIAQHAEMIDKQVRNLCEYIVYLRNFKKASVAGIHFVPFNLFLAVTTWHAAQRVVVKREVFRLTWRKDLYDTNATSHGLEAEGEGLALIPLPSPPEDRRQPPTDAQTGPAPAGRPQGAPEDDRSAEAGEPETWEPVAVVDPPFLAEPPE